MTVFDLIAFVVFIVGPVGLLVLVHVVFPKDADASQDSQATELVATNAPHFLDVKEAKNLEGEPVGVFLPPSKNDPKVAWSEAGQVYVVMDKDVGSYWPVDWSLHLGAIEKGYSVDGDDIDRELKRLLAEERSGEGEG